MPKRRRRREIPSRHDGQLLPNYPCFDAHGSLWFSDSGSFYKPNGRQFASDEARCVTGGIFPSTLAGYSDFKGGADVMEAVKDGYGSCVSR